MRHLGISSALVLATLSLAGCKSQQQVKQEDLANTQARFDAAYQRYSAACLDPLRAKNKQGVNAALGATNSKAGQTSAQPFSSPECKTSKLDMDAAQDQLTAARARLAMH